MRSKKLLEDHSFDPFLCYTKMLWFKFVAFLKHIDPFTIILPKLKKKKTFSEKLEKVVICHVRYVKHVCKAFNSLLIKKDYSCGLKNLYNKVLFRTKNQRIMFSNIK